METYISIEKLLERTQGFHGAEIIISFVFYQGDGESESVGPISATTLYRVWHGDCVRAPLGGIPKLPPSDSTKIYETKISLPTGDTLYIDEIEFGALMNELTAIAIRSKKKVRVLGHMTVSIVKEIEIYDDEKLTDAEMCGKARAQFGGIHQSDSESEKSISVNGEGEYLIAEDDIDFDSFDIL